MGLKETVLKWFIPSELIQKLKGNKTYLGFVLLVLWAAIYAIPAACQTELCIAIAAAGLKAQEFIASLGFDVSAEVLNLGSILTLFGLADKFSAHWLTKAIVGILRLVEKALSELLTKSPRTAT